MSFKRCSKCGRQWQSREEWLLDPALKLVGYQVNFKTLEAGIFLFNHNCRTTLALQASEFKDLHDGPIFRERATGSESCPGHCLHKDNLGPCPAQCECSYIRNILQIIKDYAKIGADAGGRPCLAKHESAARESITDSGDTHSY